MRLLLLKLVNSTINEKCIYHPRFLIIHGQYAYQRLKLVNDYTFYIYNSIYMRKLVNHAYSQNLLLHS